MTALTTDAGRPGGMASDREIADALEVVVPNYGRQGEPYYQLIVGAPVRDAVLRALRTCPRPPRPAPAGRKE